MADQDLTIRILAEVQQANAALREIQDGVKGVSKTTEQASKSFKASFTEINNAIGVAKQAIEAMKKVYDFAKEGAQAMRLQKAGEELARSYGMSMDDIVSALKEASLGTVSEVDLMASANKAMMLGVATSAEDMVKLMQVAAERGKAMGLSTTQAFNDIVTGVGRMSPLILDNLGIVTGGQKTFSDYAKSIGKTADELTDAEKKQALLTKVLKGVGPVTEDAATGFERLEASITDFTVAAQSATATAAGPFIESINGILDEQTRLIVAEGTLKSAIEAGIITREQYNEILRGGTANMAEEADALGVVLDMMDDRRESVEAFAAAHKDVADSAEDAGDEIDDMKGYIEDVLGLDLGGFDDLKRAIEDITEAGQWQNSGEAIATVEGLIKDGLNPNLEDSQEYLEDIGAIDIAKNVNEGKISTGEAKKAAEELGLSWKDDVLPLLKLSVEELDKMAKSRTATFTYKVKFEYGQWPGTGHAAGGNILDALAAGGTIPLTVRAYAGGGALVGERGPEFITPGGWVMPKQRTDQYLALETMVGEMSKIREDISYMIRKLPLQIRDAMLVEG